LREHVAPDLFQRFDAGSFPSTSLPALTLVASAHGRDARLGEQVSLQLRDMLFEQGRDISALEVLADIAGAHGLDVSNAVDRASIDTDWEEGRRRGVEGSPHFFVGAQGFFCPSLDIERVDGHLRIGFDPEQFDEFAQRAFASD
jgi:predicted DsbA family dithiol-disulfide isomerase